MAKTAPQPHPVVVLNIGGPSKAVCAFSSASLSGVSGRPSSASIASPSSARAVLGARGVYLNNFNALEPRRARPTKSVLLRGYLNQPISV
jgi:hypothetical protein